MTSARVIRRLDHRGDGADRYELRCGCGRVIVSSRTGVDALQYLRCGRCGAADEVFEGEPEDSAEPTAGGAT